MPNPYTMPTQPWRLSVAPMLDVTDRHCRYFHRLLAPHALLYTEMVTTGALIHGDIPRHLQFNDAEHPVALQLGGSDPKDLAHCAKLATQWGYDEINLNCGCPSERVQKGAFGACLMQEPELVADCFLAMQESTDRPITIKHRLGLGYSQDLTDLYRFIETLYQAGCRVFISHARNAILQGLSPKDNREIPPLRYEVVAQLKRDFPDALFILNGGLSTLEQMQVASQSFDGIMIGRVAWHEPYRLQDIDQILWPDSPALSGQAIIQAMYDYAKEQVAQDVPLHFVTKPMLGLFNGRKGAKQWRRELSNSTALKTQNPDLILHAWAVFEKIQQS